MDGWELVGYLQNDSELSTVPIGIQSGDRDTTLPDGVAFVLQKPIDVDALLAVVRHHCG